MSLPENVGIYGGGRMGAGIAHAFLASGSSVVIVERSEEDAVSARARVELSLSRAAERAADGGFDLAGAQSRLSVTAERQRLAECGLVIEAVPEDVAMKIGVLSAVEKTVPGAWLATNTSSLSIDSIAAGLEHPERLIGLHFFNPVPVSDLVEIVRGAETAPELVARAQEWVEGLSKTAITVSDTPGFASSRLGVAIALEAMRMVEEGVASAEDVDTAMTLGYRHPMGPLRTTDVVGLDVRLAIAEYLTREVGPRFTPPQILRDLVAQGHVGRKSGQGFYTW